MAIERLQFVEVTQEMRDSVDPFAARSPRPAMPAGPFRVGELSRQSGVPIGTIKYYLREGLLPAGTATAKTQALYGAEHLRRLRVLGVLTEVGGLSIADMRRVTTVMDEEGPSEPGELEQAVSYALPSPGRGTASREVEGEEPSEAAAALADARAASDAFVDTLGFAVDPEAPARADLADALHALRSLGIADDPIIFYDHARLAYELAEIESASTPQREDPVAKAEAITIGTVIFGAVFLSLRRMAHEHELRRRLDLRPEGYEERSAPFDPGPAVAGTDG